LLVGILELGGWHHRIVDILVVRDLVV